MATNNKVTNKHKDLGIFYTDPAIANFIFSIISIWKQAEDDTEHRWLRHKPKPKYPSVIDPAVGEGVFLKSALESKFTDAAHVFGLDLDEDVVEKWKQIHLLKAFGGIEKDLLAHFFHQNGLDRIHWEQHTSSYRYQLKQEDINNQQFDLAVGNPPYGGTGLDVNEATDSLVEQLRNFELLGELRFKLGSGITDRTSLFEDTKKSIHIDSTVSKRIKSFPVEVLFMEKFLKLTKPGGWAAIILPEGIFANSNANYVREFIASQAKIEAIVSLPRDAFKNVGTNAKTSILFLRKYGRKLKAAKDYKVFLGEVSSLSSTGFDFLTTRYKEYYGGNMSDPVQLTKNQNEIEQAMVRTDKTMRTLADEKPFSRWDVNYWHPRWDASISVLRKSNHQRLKDLFDDNSWLISTDHVRPSKGERELPEGKIQYITPNVLKKWGYQSKSATFCTENAYKRMSRANPNYEDVLLGGFGMGPTGKSVVIDETIQKGIVANIFILRVKKKIDPYLLDVFFKSKYGQAQFDRYKTGVAFNSLSNEEIRSIILPVFSDANTNKISGLARQANSIGKSDENTALSLMEEAIKTLEEVVDAQQQA